MSRCGYDLDRVLDLAPSQIYALVDLLEEQRKKELADHLIVIREAMWAKSVKSLVDFLSGRGKSEEMGPGEQRISGFKVTVGKGKSVGNLREGEGVDMDRG